MAIEPLFCVDGKKAIVTGAASGLGRAMALGLAEAGADVAIADINMDGTQDVARQIERLGVRALPIHVDISESGQVEQMVETVLREFGTIDILINNAGIPPVGRLPSHQMKQESWDKVINVDLRGLFLCARLVGQKMVEQRSGKIINIASISGMLVNKGQAGMSAFCSAKAAVIHLTKVLATEWAPYNIKVNCISPGYMMTPALQDVAKDPKRLQQLIDLVPMGRIGEPEELKGAVLFLASEASSYVTGHNLVVDGGHTAW
ncbi:MAG: glucose 1-dehydrogenase [Actinobacteria bacterium]|nr:glucose 1-dehydrogenase [Actinomycetota bacterium]